jgi:hypothetical protein
VSEIEERLRAAMHAAVAEEQAPANLAEMVRLRRRLHRTRAAAVAAAAVAVIAVGAFGLRASAPRALQPGAPPAAAPPLLPPARTVNVVDRCSQAIWAPLQPGWQRQSVQAGPLWFVGLRQASASPAKYGQARIGGLMVVVRDGTTAWVTVVGPADNYFRFLFGPGDFSRGADGPYTINNGETGVTFAGCSAGSAPGYTEYGGYFLLTVPRSCVTLDAWSLTGGSATRVTFPVNGGRCESG